MKRVNLLFLSIILLLLSSSIFSQIPRVINYQGKLLGSDEKPVSEGDYKITFSIYTETDSLLWSEVHGNVFVHNGLFHVLLGTVTPLDLPFNREYFLGIKVNSDPELWPRMFLTSSAYSFNSERVGGYEVRPTPTANTILPLDNSGKIPASALPSSSNSGSYISKNSPDSTKGTSNSEMLRIENDGTGRGMTVMSSGSHGIYSKSNSDMAGLEGVGTGNGAGIRGSSINHHGVIGYSVKNDKAGVYGNNTDGIGVYGNSKNNHGVYGQSNTGRGVKGVSAAGGVYGESTQGVAVEGRSNANDGVVGWSNNQNKSGVFGNSPFGNGVTGISEKRDGILGVTTSSDAGHAGVHARNDGTGPALYSEGDLYTTGKVYGDIGPSEGAPFPRPAFNSGWLEVHIDDIGFWHTVLDVDQYMPTSKYNNEYFLIDLMTKTSAKASNQFLDQTYYHIYPDNSIRLGLYDPNEFGHVSHLRLRIWYIK